MRLISRQNSDRFWKYDHVYNPFQSWLNLVQQTIFFRFLLGDRRSARSYFGSSASPPGILGHCCSRGSSRSEYPWFLHDMMHENFFIALLIPRGITMFYCCFCFDAVYKGDIQGVGVVPAMRSKDSKSRREH